jgi:hypothetical protein
MDITQILNFEIPLNIPLLDELVASFYSGRSSPEVCDSSILLVLSQRSKASFIAPALVALVGYRDGLDTTYVLKFSFHPS